MIRAIVTGGAGFIGSHLCEKLLEMGWEVVCVDDLSTGSVHNIKHLFDKSNFEFIEKEAEAYWSNGRFDYMFHLASPASPKDYMLMPEKTLDANSAVTHKMLRMTGLFGKVMVFASTSEVYGDPLEHPQTEHYYGNVNSFGPRSCYDEGKRCGEAYCKVFSDMGIDVRVARIFNTYGPRMRGDDGRVVSNFITQALRGDPLTVYGGDQTRSFCFVDDTVRGLVDIALRGKPGEVYNLGNPKEITIKELGEEIRKIITPDNEFVYRITKMPKDDPNRRCPDITKIKEIGWSPIIRLKAGLMMTISYFKKQTSYHSD